MKKKYFRLASALLLSLSLLCVPAFASPGFSVIYDGTEELGSDALTELGENTLPMFSEQLGIEMRVDVLTLGVYDKAQEAAAAMYDHYSYGFGEDMRGVTLTILMEPEEDTYAMVPGEWCIYVGGSDESLADGRLQSEVTAAVEPYMAARAWDGSDITMSATALTQATSAMLSSVSDYFLGDGGADTQTGESTIMHYMLDYADLLSFDEWRALENRAKTLSAEHGCGIYAVTVDNYTSYGDDIESVTHDIYEQLELGEGEERNGIILLLSGEDRDFAVFTYGAGAESAFDEYGLAQLEESFLDNFAEDDWNGGFSDYIEECGSYLALAESGTPVRKSPWGSVCIGVGGGMLISLVVCLILKGKMHSVSRKAEANEYVSTAGLRLTERQEMYTHTTETRTKIKSQSSGGSGGSGGHGRTGKF